MKSRMVMMELRQMTSAATKPAYDQKPSVTMKMAHELIIHEYGKMIKNTENQLNYFQLAAE